MCVHSHHVQEYGLHFTTCQKGRCKSIYPPQRQQEPQRVEPSLWRRLGILWTEQVSQPHPRPSILGSAAGPREEGWGTLSGLCLSSATTQRSFGEESRYPGRATLRTQASYLGDRGPSEEQQA